MTMIPQDRSTHEQEQFLKILSREDAVARFAAALFPRAIPSETRKLADALGAALLRAGTIIGSREIGMLAACGIAEVMVARRTRVAVLSTGDELVQPGAALRPAAIYDTNGAIVTAAISENGGDAMFLGAVADDEDALEAAMRDALTTCDMLVLSGGTSKGAGDVSHRIIARLGRPGIIAHGVALKPGKPLCLAVCDGKPVVILPGFPTSAMFTFHDMIVPVLRRMAGLPPRSDAKC